LTSKLPSIILFLPGGFKEAPHHPIPGVPGSVWGPFGVRLF
jgi:hypothetical protein